MQIKCNITCENSFEFSEKAVFYFSITVFHFLSNQTCLAGVNGKPVGREGATGALAPRNRPQRSTFLLTNDLNQSGLIKFFDCYSRVSMGWCLLRLSAKILALLRLSVNFFQLRLTIKLKINFFCFKKLNTN